MRDAGLTLSDGAPLDTPIDSSTVLASINDYLK